MFYTPNSVWTWSFLLVAVIQAIVALGLECYVFAEFEMSLTSNADQAGSVTRTIPCYLSLLIFGFIYQLVLVYDALHKKNTIQIIGICAYNLAILIYTAIEMDQVRDAVTALLQQNHIQKDYLDLWITVRPYLIAVPCVIALGTALLCLIAWKLYEEFAWTIYKQISADLRLKRRYLIYQIYIALLKFDFFLFLGFEVQFLVIVINTQDSEFIITCVSVPVIILLLFLAGYSTRKENIYGMIFSLLLYHAALAYFIFKLVRMYAPSPRRADYLPARKSLTLFAVITIVLLLVTIAVAIICTRNFGKGLKPHVEGSSFWGRRKRRGAAGAPDDTWGYDTSYAGASGYAEGAGKARGGEHGVYMDSMTAQRVDYGRGYGGGGSRMTID